MMTDVVTRIPVGAADRNAGSKGIRRAVIACSLGHGFEVYDFLIFGFFVAQIGRAFFPSADPVISLLFALATFGAGFLMRPLGAIVFGYFGDRIGRRTTLAISIGLMAVAIGLTGLLPTYEAIGLAAPILMVFCRLLQGFSMGGEWGGAATALAEHAPPGRRGFLSSFQSVAGGIAALVAILTAALLNAILDDADLQDWGWRLPFIIGALLGPVAYYLRTRVAETPAFEKVMAAATNVTRVPLWGAAIQSHGRMMLVAIGITIIIITLQYMFVIFMPSYATQTLNIDQASALYATAIGMLVYIVLTPVVGAISDRIGRRLPAFLCAASSFVLAYPAFLLLTTSPTPTTLMMVQIVGGLLQALLSGVIAATLAEMFPTAIRYTALSTSYALAVTIFGGFAPFIGTLLIRVTGDPLSPSYYIMATALISSIAVFFVKSTSPAAKLE
jgi:MFS transporter, MHS family, proline/betaine transporter